MQIGIFDYVRKVCISKWAIILENSLVNSLSDLQIKVQTLSGFFVSDPQTSYGIVLNPLDRRRYIKKMLTFCVPL